MNPQQQVPGEAAITPQAQAQVAPDVVNETGQQALFQKAVVANQSKSLLDGVLKLVAQKAGGVFDSRVKNIETAAAKIAQKRLQGRSDYGVQDVNDMVGFRITLPSKQDFSPVKTAIQSLSNAGLFAIKKQEQVTQGNYSGYHIDIRMPGGEGGEIQLHTNKSALEAVANHSLRSIYGENASPAVEALKDKQAQAAQNVPNGKALAITQVLQTLGKQQGGHIDPRQSAQILAST